MVTTRVFEQYCGVFLVVSEFLLQNNHTPELSAFMYLVNTSAA